MMNYHPQKDKRMQADSDVPCEHVSVTIYHVRGVGFDTLSFTS